MMILFVEKERKNTRENGTMNKPFDLLDHYYEVETESDGIAAACINDKMYAYPFTSDNGYFLYYDKQYVSDEDAKDIEKIIARCEENDLKINYSIFGNGFYSASYFMATGCQSLWDMDATNNFTAYHDNYNSENGLIAAKGIKYLKAHNKIKKALYKSDFCVIISCVCSASRIMV